jgi:hypothetical protein
MATWRCPNCGTLQSDSARCFLCQRSATSCGTCVLFRASFVGGVGYCARDRRREPLTGSEQRACWTGASVTVAEGFFDRPVSVPSGAIERGLLEVLPAHDRPIPAGPASISEP